MDQNLSDAKFYLRSNWDGAGAKAISRKVFDRLKAILSLLPVCLFNTKTKKLLPFEEEEIYGSLLVSHDGSMLGYWYIPRSKTKEQLVDLELYVDVTSDDRIVILYRIDTRTGKLVKAIRDKDVPPERIVHDLSTFLSFL